MQKTIKALLPLIVIEASAVIIALAGARLADMRLGTFDIGIAKTVIIAAGTLGLIALMELIRVLLPGTIRTLQDVLVAQFRKLGIVLTWPVMIGLAVAAGVGEEMLFRGLIQVWLQSQYGWAIALAGASLLFGLCHALNLAYFLLATLIGAYLGSIYLVTGNLLIVIAIHAIYDIYAFWRLRPLLDTAVPEPAEGER